MNIAQQQQYYFDSDDFKGMYFDTLFETFGDNENDVINRILTLFNVSNYETEQLSNHKIIDRLQAKKIYDFIVENFEQFVRSFSNYYVGYTSLESRSFGEQETQLTDWYNHKTGKSYSVKYLKKVFDKEGFFVSGDYAYYDLTSRGLHVDLLNDATLLDNYLKEL